jgi:hypothetical protein
MDISNLYIITWIWNLTFQYWKLLFKFKNFNSFKTWYLNSKLFFSNPKINISTQKTFIQSKNWHFDFKYFYLNLKFTISILKFLI